MATSTASFDAVFVTTAAAAYVPGTDEVGGVRDLSLEETRTMTDSAYLGDAFVTFTPNVRSVSISMSGHYLPSNTPQKNIRDAFGTGNTIYLHIIDNAAATTGTRKGTRYPVTVESWSTKYAVGDVLAFDAKFALAGTPVDINA